jgi:hypothetical protein
MTVGATTSGAAVYMPSPEQTTAGTEPAPPSGSTGSPIDHDTEVKAGVAVTETPPAVTVTGATWARETHNQTGMFTATKSGLGPKWISGFGIGIC